MWLLVTGRSYKSIADLSEGMQIGVSGTRSVQAFATALGQIDLVTTSTLLFVLIEVDMTTWVKGVAQCRFQAPKGLETIVVKIHSSYTARVAHRIHGVGIRFHVRHALASLRPKDDCASLCQ